MSSAYQWNVSRWGSLLSLDLNTLGICFSTCPLPASWNTEVPVSQLVSNRHGQCLVVLLFRGWSTACQPGITWELNRNAETQALSQTPKPEFTFLARVLADLIHIKIWLMNNRKILVFWVITWSMTFLITHPLISGLLCERGISIYGKPPWFEVSLFQYLCFHLSNAVLLFLVLRTRKLSFRKHIFRALTGNRIQLG